MTQADLPTRFAALLDGMIPREARLGVALSGGGDSMALLHLAAGTGRPVRAATVDHGLRDSSAEISLARRACAALNVPHRLLHWDWDGQGNLQAAARYGRRDRLEDWARSEDIDALLLGHTLDDQAETVILRLARGSGIDGLAGMPLVDGTTPRRMRPLLGETRAGLRDWLRAEGIAWAEDPSNSDVRFDRVRARNMADTLSTLGLTPDRLVTLADHARAARITLKHASQTWAQAHLRQDRGDLIFDAEVFDQSHDSARRALAAAVQWIGQAEYRPRWQALQSALETARSAPATLGGVLIFPEAGGIRLTRELAACAPPVPQGAIWDGRWKITGPACEGAMVGPLGDALSKVPDWRATGQPRDTLRASPALWQGDELIAAPLAGHTGPPDAPYGAQIVADFGSFLDSR